MWDVLPICTGTNVLQLPGVHPVMSIVVLHAACTLFCTDSSTIVNMSTIRRSWLWAMSWLKPMETLSLAFLPFFLRKLDSWGRTSGQVASVRPHSVRSNDFNSTGNYGTVQQESRSRTSLQYIVASCDWSQTSSYDHKHTGAIELKNAAVKSDEEKTLLWDRPHYQAQSLFESQGLASYELAAFRTIWYSLCVCARSMQKHEFRRPHRAAVITACRDTITIATV